MISQMENLYATLKQSGKNYDLEKIKNAYLFAEELHDGQFRNSGEAYITHPVAVAEIAASLSLDTDSICAALLHDTVEDCGNRVNLEIINEKFGSEVAMLVDGLTKLITIPFEDKEEQQIENIRKMLLAMSKDIRVIFIKLCDRLHNMRTLSAKPESKQRMTALETMQVYAPLAHRLGMQKIKQELENIGLRYLDSVGYNEVSKDIEKKFGQNKDFIEGAKKAVSDKLSATGINFHLEGRVKTVYSIYKKMYEQNKSFDEIYDFYALRIIVDTELECYQVLGYVHDMFKSMPGRFKDYISTPKPNFYRSLHTTVIGKDGIPFEIQIRTWDMHHVAEYGVCAHWKYKIGEKSSSEMDKKLEWVAQLIEAEDDTRDPEEFFRALKIDIFHDETFVFTPNGDVITLPQGATVIDFAYAIHSQVGNKMVGAKINGMIVPIDRVPQNGEIVEILTSSSSKGPSRDWLKIVTTGNARNKIRQWFKKEKREENIILGKAELEKEFKRLGHTFTELQKAEILSNVAKKLGIQSVEDLFNTVGFGGLSVSKLTGKIKDEGDKIINAEKPAFEDIPVIATHPKVKKSQNGIIIDGADNCTVKLAHCCNPVPGDKIIGFITKGYGVSIHKNDCPVLQSMLTNEEYKNRFVSAYWENGNENNRDVFNGRIEIIAKDRLGLLADITTRLAEMNVMLLGLNTQIKGNYAILCITVSCRNLEHMKMIMAKIQTIKDIEECRRIAGN